MKNDGFHAISGVEAPDFECLHCHKPLAGAQGGAHGSCVAQEPCSELRQPVPRVVFTLFSLLFE